MKISRANFGDVERTNRFSAPPGSENETTAKRLRRAHAGTFSTSALRHETATTVPVSDETDVGEAISALSARRYTIVRVVCGSGFRELNESALIDAAAKYGVGTPLKTVISRLTERE